MALQAKIVEFLYKMRIDATVKCIALSEGYDAGAFNPYRAGEGWKLRKNMVRTLASGDWAGGTSVTHDDLDEPRQVEHETEVSAQLPRPFKRLPSSGAGGSDKALTLGTRKQQGSGGRSTFSQATAVSGSYASCSEEGGGSISGSGSCSAARPHTPSPLDDSVYGVSTSDLPGLARKPSVLSMNQLFTAEELESQANVLSPPPSPRLKAGGSGLPSPPGSPNGGDDALEGAADDRRAFWEKTMWATRVLNKLLIKYSESSALVMTNLPIPGDDSLAAPAQYMAQIDQLTQAVPLMLLVAGVNDLETITMHS